MMADIIGKALVRIHEEVGKLRRGSEEVRPGPHFWCPYQRANARYSLPDVAGTGAELLHPPCLLHSSSGCPMPHH